MRFFAIFYSLIIRFRNFLFDSGFLKAKKFNSLVISVGNLLAGGTGKTPVVDFLIRLFKEENLKIGIISRGYKGRFKGVKQVNIQDIKKGASVFGDEPLMLALKHKKIPIFVGKNKRKTIETLLKEHPVDLVIADDAFQHRFLYRDFDLVVIDALAEISDYEILPQGRARESMNSLKRSHLVLLNRLNLVSKEKKEQIITKIKKYFFSGLKESKKKLPIVEINCFIDSVKRLSDDQKVNQWERKRILLASGIGRPSSFSKMMKKKNQSILKHRIFKDHHPYTLKDIKSLMNEKKKLGADLIVITEKDAVKFLSFPEQTPFFCVAQMGLKISDSILDFKSRVLEKLQS